MNREELRDQLLVPALQWIRLGRQTSELMVGSMEVISERSRRLMRGAMLRGPHDWAEMGLMTKEKAVVPLQSAVAMASTMQAETQQFLTQATEVTLAVAGSAMSLASSRSVEDLRVRQAAMCSAVISAALSWYQLSGRAAEVAEQGLRPILRQVRHNAERLGQR